ncbi:hypothetical protein [Sphingomicrobium aestuariivivum]|uniref:hypothetical protein n=1 Tax=Sphingomicrobium aestuariivivum TaxID=1582356 RepID=UPI001FD703E4|nr:hypothetical protein [Sphingomicrobium aestuariivivum]MCJ8191075.1 hypothetical protein [Sphingomicrobium aestuariivivum]
MAARFWHYAALAIALAFLLFGLVRLGVGALLTLQSMGMVETAWLAEPVAEVTAFLERKNAVAIFAMSPTAYFLVIMAMGALLLAGAGRYLLQRGGLGFLAAYLGIHGLLFVNFLEINPKLWLWGATIAGWLVLWQARRLRRPSAKPAFA